MDNQKIINLSKTLFEITNQGTDILSTYSLAEKLVAANCGYLKIGERIHCMSINYDDYQLSFA